MAPRALFQLKLAVTRSGPINAFCSAKPMRIKKRPNFPSTCCTS